MVVGFNHNFRYQGEVYHVQTEDSGLKNPHIITLLYRGGTILASKKTSYADIARVDNLDQVVEDLMKEQHKEMLRRLKDGEFDDIIKGRRPAAAPAPEPSAAASAAPEVAASVAAPAAPARAADPRPAAPPATAASTAPPAPKEVPVEKVPPKEAPPAAAPELSLDDVILSYLVGDDK